MHLFTMEKLILIFIKTIAILFSIILLSCSSGQKDLFEENNEDNIKLSVIDSFYVTVPDSINYDFWNTNIIEENDTIYYFTFNATSNDFCIFNVNSNRLVHYFKIPKEGPNSIRKIYDCFFYNKDSIYSIDYWGRLSLINIQQNTVENNEVPYKEDSLYSYDIYVFGGRNKLIFTKGYFDEEEKSDRTMMCLYDIKRKKIIKYFGYLPDNYIKFQLQYPDANSVLLNDTSIIVNYELSNYLFVYNIDGSFKTKIKCKSNYIKANEFSAYDKSSSENNIYDIANSKTTSAMYYNLVYDKYRNIYYRFVKHSQKLLDNNGLKKRIIDAQKSIIVLDNKLKIIGEVMLDESKNKYLFSIYPTKKGIILTKNSEEENKIEFNLFKITIHYD